MSAGPFSAAGLRAMYRNGRAGPAARRLARLWAAMFALGLAPRRWVTLEVPGRRSGRLTRFPLGLASLDGRWYLVPMLGAGCNWVQNVRAAGGRAVLRHGRAVACTLTEVPVGERGPVIKRYLRQVPGARPHIPVSRRAPAAEFDAIAPRYPVFRVEPGPPRVRRWWRWTAAGLGALVLIIIAATIAFVKFQPTLAPLTLPARAAGPAAGPVSGTWRVASGSLAGFRVRETVLGFSNYTVGRTSSVTGTLVISGNRVTEARFRIDLGAVKVGGKTQPQFARSLDTAADPDATFILTRPVTLSPAFTSGAAVTARATGRLVMHGVSRLVTFTIHGRRDGTGLQVAGSIPVRFPAWDIARPAGFGWLGSLAGRGTAEFLLTFRTS